MTQITYIKSSLRHSSALTTPEVALTQFGLWKSIKRAFKKFAKPLAVVAGIALAIAVPFIAAPVAGMIFGSTALAGAAGTFGATISAALTGAGLGAVSGALTAYGTGQNVLMGAAMGGLGGAIGGGVAGYASGVGQAAGAAGTAGMAGTAGTAAAPGVVTASNAAVPTATGTIGAAGTTAATTASTGIGSRLLEATLKAAPGAVGTLVSSLAPSDVGAATAELQAEMQRLQNSDIDAYNKAKVLYDQLYARYQQIDPVAAAQLAEANVQMKTAGLISGVNVARGAASAEYAGEAEKRRLGVEGSQEASGAYTGTYYQGEGEKTRALAGLSPPVYGGRSGEYLARRLGRAEEQQAGLGADVAAALTPYTLALAPRDTTVTSEDYDRLLRENDSLRRRRLTEDSLTGA